MQTLLQLCMACNLSLFNAFGHGTIICNKVFFKINKNLLRILVKNCLKYKDMNLKFIKFKVSEKFFSILSVDIINAVYYREHIVNNTRI